MIWWLNWIRGILTPRRVRRQRLCKVLKRRPALPRPDFKMAIAHVQTIRATVESDRATAAADAAQNDKAQSDFKRYEDLYKTKVVSPQDVDQFRATAKSAQATLDAANKKVLSDEAQVEEARAQVDALQALVESVNAQINESDANLATAKLNQSYTRILAPDSGWVTQKSVEPGQYVQAGQNLFALVPKDVWVTANFKEDQIRRMRPGQTVEIAVDALHGQKLPGAYREHPGRQWSSIQSSPASECHRQLREGDSAYSGQDPVRRTG